MDEQNQPPVPPHYPQPNNAPEQPEEASVVSSDIEPPTEQTSVPAPSYDTPRPAPLTPPLSMASQDSFQSQPPRVKRKKWPFIAIAAALLIVLLGGGAALAYTFWYQNPQHVIMDGLANALQAKTLSYKGTVNVTDATSQTTVKLDLTGAAASGNANLDIAATISQGSQHYLVHGNGVFDKNGVLYVRFQDLDTVLKTYLGSSPDIQLPAGTQPLIDQLVAKFNNRWIKISPSDLQDFSSTSANSLTCLQQASDTFRNDKNTRKELADLYQKDPFIHVDKDLGTKNGSIGYAISPDEGKQKAFVADIKNTAFYKKIHDCDSDFTIDGQDDTATNDVKNAQTEIWLSQWQHEITNVILHEEDKSGAVSDMSLQPEFNKPVTVAIPSNAATIDELKADIQSIYMEYVLSQLGTMPTASKPGQPL